MQTDNTALNLIFFGLLIACYVLFALIAWTDERHRKAEYKKYMQEHKFSTWTYEDFCKYTYTRWL